MAAPDQANTASIINSVLYIPNLNRRDLASPVASLGKYKCQERAVEIEASTLKGRLRTGSRERNFF
jgi:hypothetical protein